jgi:hypothetical protein
MISIALVREPQAQNTDPVLAAMRAALGGDALKSVQAFTIGGKLERDVGERTIAYAVDLTCLLPDKCVRRTRQLDGPETTTYEGFSGDDPILRREGLRRTAPPLPVPDPTATTARFKKEFGRLQLVLFGSTPATYPLQLASAGQDRFEGRAMDVIELKHDEVTAKLLVDAGTHLPAALAWTTPPVVISRPTRISIPGGRGGTAPLPDGPRWVPPGVVYVTEPPTPEMVASLPPVENRIEFSDFKTSDGITWPRRILKRVQGHITEVWRLETVKINPRVDPRWFNTSR